jgi:hypothetical protein
MIPIISHGQAGEQGYTFSNFEALFLNICESHREERRALAFAFILYDLRSPQVAKALKDLDYWQALDKISDRYLSVFSFHTMPSQRLQRRRRNSNNNHMKCMTSVSIDDFEDGRSMLERYFYLEQNIKLPAILFFQVSNAEIVGSKLVQLTKDTTEESFIEIKDIISGAAEAVSSVKDENHRNDHVIFQLIEDNLNNRGIKVITSAVIDKFKSAKELLSLFGI